MAPQEIPMNGCQTTKYRLNHLPGRIKQVRMQAGLSQREFAERIGVHWSSVQDWEKGRSMPMVLQLVRMAVFTSVTTDWLIGIGSPNMSPTKVIHVRGLLADAQVLLTEALDDPPGISGIIG